jgi:hypothetical protein
MTDNERQLIDENSAMRTKLTQHKEYLVIIVGFGILLAITHFIG